MKLRTISKSEHETKHIAQTIASCFNLGDLILLDGDLGTGKTYFVKGFAEGIGSADPVTSPTFSLANFYSARNGMELLHIDLYRVESVDEFNDLGLTDFFPQTITVIEWGMKFAGIFDDYFSVSLAYCSDKKDAREITLSCTGEKHIATMNSIAQKLPNLISC